MKRIQLVSGSYAKVDDEDCEFLNQWKWYLFVDRAISSKIITYKGRVSKHMSLLLIDRPEGMQIDHINRDALDNRKSNLRACTSSQNHMNRRLQKNNRAGFKGVHWSRSNKKYYAKIYLDGKAIFLGLYDDIYEAASTYNEAAKKWHGEFANLNKIPKQDMFAM